MTRKRFGIKYDPSFPALRFNVVRWKPYFRLLPRFGRWERYGDIFENEKDAELQIKKLMGIPEIREVPPFLHMNDD